MNYSITWLLAEINQKKSLKYLYFWGHKVTHDGSTTKSCLSQWWFSAFTVEGITYPTAEHWMMAEKARLFKDDKMLSKILASKSPAEAKKFGRKVQGFDHTIWEANAYEIVKQGNIHKFGQNPDLRAFLLNTGDRVLVEASPVDPIWGIGLAQDHRDVTFPEKWCGTNLLGFALMEARDALISTIE